MTQRNTLFVGKVFFYFPELPSTNDYALNLLSKSKPSEGTLISTDHQTRGRGQIGSRWESEPGQNIMQSVIFYPTFLPVSRQFQLNQAIALAVRDCIAKYVEKPVIVKWPNDVYVEESKIAGILIQNSVAGTLLQSSVAGIGINVNQAGFAAHLPNPTSIYLQNGGIRVSLEEVTNTLCQTLESRYLALRQGQMDALHEEYLAWLYRYQQTAIYRRTNGEVLEGKITGIAEDGRLLIAHEDGTEAFDLKSIAYC